MISFPVSNSRLSKATFNIASSFSSNLGQPFNSGKPGVEGHLSSLSGILSPSLSFKGQPLFSTGPATVGHLSSL